MSNRREIRAQAQQFIDTLTPLQHPNSEKVYLTGSREDLRVGMRQILQSDTMVGGTESKPILESNAPLKVYDCAGPYSDPDVEINVRKGLAKFRQHWIEERGDTEQLEAVSSGFTQQRLADDGLDHLRFDSLLPPRKAQSGKCVTQLHYARKGIITPEMEYIAIRENMEQNVIEDKVLRKKRQERVLAHR